MFSLICTVPLTELADVMHYISPEHSTLCSNALAMLIRVSSQQYGPLTGNEAKHRDIMTIDACSSTTHTRMHVKGMNNTTTDTQVTPRSEEGTFDMPQAAMSNLILCSDSPIPATTISS
jgi:hypothetical protein